MPTDQPRCQASSISRPRDGPSAIATSTAQVSQRQADALRAALGSLLHYKPKRYSMYRDEELLALAARRAGSPLWRLVTRVLA